MERAALLHNMSLMPRTVITHRPPGPRARQIAFRLAPEIDPDPAALLQRLDGKPWSGTPEEAGTELRRRLQAHAAKLPFPAAVLVSGHAACAGDGSDDLLTVCAILAKSSGNVYLRDKEPILARIRKDRVVVLHIPDRE